MSTESKCDAASMHFNAVEIIAKKRDGNALCRAEIEYFIQTFQDGGITDYQMSAWLMAVYIRGMSDDEVAWLTMAMCRSGLVANWDDIPGAKVDKHSTGGVGDKISLPLAPLVASFGIVVPMMSGRGLGHTGGTLDKLESIAGFNPSLSMTQFRHALSTVGCAIVSATAEVAPVDKRMYALRDVTATTESMALICSSIMSKKLAEGPDALVLDVKAGRGAFLKNFDDSIALAKLMTAAGEGAGKPTVCLVTNMNQPLGCGIGNWFEVAESIEVLHGRGPADVRELVLQQAAHMLLLAGKFATLPECLAAATAHLDDDTAWRKFRDMVIEQGGDVAVIDAPEKYPVAAHSGDVTAPRDGVVTAIDALEIGLTNVGLGAGRSKVADAVDFCAGVMLQCKVGAVVKAGDVLATVHTERESALAGGVARVSAAYTIADAAAPAEPLIHGVVTKTGYVTWDEYQKQK